MGRGSTGSASESGELATAFFYFQREQGTAGWRGRE